ncbi:hypothetical protein POPTR_015G118900v4 [Populus trichocarpa]|uniref:Protein PHLOEM PROTEIN 2-LIKE A9-like n=4 Tax=Populus trichocarpa TaxID=3694 RepID=A0A3N7G167_POPTR|nr:protein PHLOEM PROTEIN 2-LIKE A9 isoform X1 [Populus trichocarpa]XP_052303390.1 protein PHLOEM PROTEIN 2-LIKE A9 isoform X2 [Populus trichocarpa]KAI5563219.1 hypothetical protein BDE02_15G101900 [Populus trichocarpa]RQP00938.1 hypothetical protein POPTR_015G118900v4 [Populus trichocarpa]|eukprot:XP_006374712.2 protein PHLOEM PROTEIN 2-LIKE A9 [Populus trichocarpa]
MSSTSKNSSRGARRSRPQPLKLFLKEFRSWFYKSDSSGVQGLGGRGNMNMTPKEPTSSTVGSETDKVSSEGPDGKTVFKPKDLKICWKEESQFWSIPEGDDGPAELLEVCWLDVSGEMPVTKGKTYEVSFMLSMNTKNSFGWDDPVTVMARIGKEGKYQRKEIKLLDLSGEVKEFPPDKCRIEFKSDENAKNDKETLYFGLYEMWTNKWKGGLRIHEAIVQEIPAGNNDRPPNTRSDESRGKEIAAHDD